jgi:ankyrin repeat protein
VSAISSFESAADAIVAGDAATLERILAEDPELIRARSPRAHHATLLHYVGANGIEDERQKTPKNAVEILGILLRAGAEINARADMYGGDTTLELVATSVHPVIAGVQKALMESLLDAGAALDPGGRIVNLCLANGRGPAAEFLAARGARLDLEGAAGVGRLDLVEALFPGATSTQVQSGLNWACEYGRDRVVLFLLDHGADLSARDRNGQTAMHWAAIGGQVGCMRILLQRKPDLEAKNDYGGTVLGQALWSAKHDESGADYAPMIELLKSLRAGGGEKNPPSGQ